MQISRNLAQLICCSWFALALGCGGASIDRLAAQLNDPDVHVRRSAATELAGVRSSSSRLIAALALASRNDDVEVREIAVEGLGKKAVENNEAVPPLEQALTDQEQSVRLKAALATHRLDPQNVSYRPVLLDSLKAGQGTVFLEVGRMGADARWAVPTLVAVLGGDRRPSIRALAARTLAKVGPADGDAMAALIRAQRDPAPAVRKAARNASQIVSENARPTVDD